MDKGILLTVTYDVNYKNDNLPEQSGINTLYYTVIDEGGEYKIASIGTGP